MCVNMSSLKFSPFKKCQVQLQPNTNYKNSISLEKRKKKYMKGTYWDSNHDEKQVSAHRYHFATG